MKIRKATKEDKVKIKRLISMILRDIFNSKPEGLEDLDDIEKNFDLFLVIEENGKIIGTAGIKDAKISRMYVKKSERGRGIGKKLMQKLFDYSASKFKRIFLATYPQMNSQGFYKKMGFKVFKRDEQVWMEKILK